MPNPERFAPDAATPTGRGRSRQAHPTLQAGQVKELAVGRYAELLAATFPITQPLLDRPGKHGPCPLCGGTDRARFFPDVAETGGFLCNQCAPSSVQGINTFMHFGGWDFRTALKDLARQLGITSGCDQPRSRKVPLAVSHIAVMDLADQTKRRQALQRVWNASVSMSDPCAEAMRRYLRNRGLGDLQVTDVLRFHAALPYWDKVNGGTHLLGYFPTMLARIDSPDGKPLAIHRTYLTPGGEKLTRWNGLDLSARKKMSPAVPGSSRGAAIRLFPASDRLGVAEGIETALAAYKLTGAQMPVWSAVDAGGLEAVVLPDHVRRVVIFADRDPNRRGEEAAIVLAQRLVREKREVKRVLPPLEYGAKADWNDLLMPEVTHGE